MRTASHHQRGQAGARSFYEILQHTESSLQGRFQSIISGLAELNCWDGGNAPTSLTLRELSSVLAPRRSRREMSVLHVPLGWPQRGRNEPESSIYAWLGAYRRPRGMIAGGASENRLGNGHHLYGV